MVAHAYCFPMLVRDATQSDVGGILSIHNDAIVNTTAIWDETPVDLADRLVWFRDRTARGLPVVVAARDDVILGFGSFGEFRERSGYARTVEHSVYVHPEHRGQGIGRLLLGALVDRAQALGKHVMIGGIESGNAASLRLHEGHGFERVGHLPEVGFKFGRWLDLVFMQRIVGQ